MLSFVKKHWLVILIVLALVGVAIYFGFLKAAIAAVGGFFALLFGRRSNRVSSDLAKMEQIRKDEAKKIDDIRNKEREDLIKNDAKLKVDLEKIADEDTKEKQKIADEKSRRALELSKKRPDDIADELAKKHGFKIIRPEE